MLSKKNCVVVTILLALGVSALASPRAADDAAGRGKDKDKANTQLTRLVTGDPAQLNAVVAGDPPTATVRITPIMRKSCSGTVLPLPYRACTVDADCGGGAGSCADRYTVVGQELRAESGDFRAWFEVQVLNWDPNGDGTPAAKIISVKVDAMGYLDADAPGDQPNLFPPPKTGPDKLVCLGGNNAVCRTAYGDAFAACEIPPNHCNGGPNANELCNGDADCPDDPGCPAGDCTCIVGVNGKCTAAYATKSPTQRRDGWCAPGGCSAAAANTGSDNFVWVNIYETGSRPDYDKTCVLGDNNLMGCNVDDDCPAGTCTGPAPGPAYAGTLVLQVPDGAKGKYTVGLDSPGTWMTDTANAEILLSAETGFVVNILTGQCCDTGVTPVVCISDQFTRAECDASGGVFDPTKTCADGCAAACCLPGGSCEWLSPADCSAGGGLLTTECLGDADGSGRDDACEGFIRPDTDCWKTVCGRTQVSFHDNPIPAGFFDPGSEPFASQIRLGGASGPGQADTRVRRLRPVLLDSPGSVSIPIELVELNLVSCDPIQVMTNGVPVLWNVQVGLSTAPPPPPPPVGNITVNKTHPNGGTFEAQFPVQARFVFSAVCDPPDPTCPIRVLDTGQVGRPPVMLQTLGSAPWVHRPKAGCTVLVCGENFVPGVEEDAAGTQCCRKIGHAGPGHLHETAPPDCSCCPTVSGACCDPSTGACNVVAGAVDCPGDYEGDGTDCDDTDGDGLPDVAERNDCSGPAGDRCDAPSNPLIPDTDGDGCSDGAEVAAGTDPCDPCQPAGGCPGSEDCDGNGIADRCELPGNDCNGDGKLDRCPENDPQGACCNNWPGCAEVTKAECDRLASEYPESAWIFQGYCTRCPTQDVLTNEHNGVAVVHFPAPVPECSITGGVAAAEDCTSRQCLYDTWITDALEPTCHNFDNTGDAPAIPAGFFGQGSDLFEGQVCFEGVPLGPTPPHGEYGDADTIICRSADSFDRCALPGPTPAPPVDIRIVGLSLKSKLPIAVTYSGQNTEFWDVTVTLSDRHQEVPTPLELIGSLTATKTHCNGGTYTSVLPVRPKFTFTKVELPNTQLVLDTGQVEGWPVFTLVQKGDELAVPPIEDPPWVHDPQAELRVVVDPCTNFHPGIRDVQQVTGCDCNGNLQGDKCDLEGTSQDCNNNGIPDDCELSGNDCNANGIPDECEPDCNGNGRADGCDVPPPAGNCTTNCSIDCNANGVPDECEPDCNRNGRPDACDLALNSSQDCTLNGRPDECDLGSGATADCQRNQRPDPCDILIGVSADANADLVPDECDIAPPQPPQRDPGLKDTGRTLLMRVASAATAAAASQTALRVTPVDLQRPRPSNFECCPAPDFSAYESPTCTAEGESNNCARWVGKPGTFRESQDIPELGSFRGARLQCTPYYHEWSAEGVFSVVGGEIAPSSEYDVQTLAGSCDGAESTCTAVSAPFRIRTARYGDVVDNFQDPNAPFQNQPDGLDINEVINKFKGLTTTSKALTQLQPNLPELNVDVSGLDISTVIDAFKRFAYSYSGPCPCPSTVTCGSVACANLQCRTCVSGGNAGKPCSVAGDCPGGACSGTVLTCVKTCLDGDNIGDPCIKDIHCPGTPASTCGNPFCRDRCGRCN